MSTSSDSDTGSYDPENSGSDGEGLNLDAPIPSKKFKNKQYIIYEDWKLGAEEVKGSTATLYAGMLGSIDDKDEWIPEKMVAIKIMKPDLIE